MSFARARALRSLQSSLRHTGVRASPRASAPARTQLAVTKRFASGGGAHAHGEPTSDLPWLFGAIAITLPTCWYLWPTTSHAEHHDSHDAHSEETGEDAEDDAPADEESKDTEAPAQEESESKDEQKDEKDENSGDDGEEKSNEQEESTNDSEEKDSGQGGSDKTGVGKGKGKNLDDTRKHEESDSKGASKKRIDSGLGKDLGKGTQTADSEGDEPTRDNSATAKKPQKGEEGEISSKQFGLSTTATKHSTQIDQDPEKSKKGEGTPETAKAMGTVAVDRPAR